MDELKGIAGPLPELMARTTTAEQWRTKRRPEFLKLFTELMYGEAPPAEAPKATILSERPMEGFLQRNVRLHTGILGPVALQLTLPLKQSKPAPTFLALNFTGNDSLHSGPTAWSFAEAARRGFAIATVCYEELAADRKDSPLFESKYRAVSLWAWGFSRMLDWALTVPELDGKKQIALGHSRLGKATLLAGARDERFAAVIPHQSGTGGAAPSRGTIGESVQRINTVFPHWFNDAYKKFNERTGDLPFDQHCLLACVAPRPILLSNAQDDTWANYDGQFSLLDAALPAWKLLGGDEKLVQRFMRPGKHALTPEDWSAFLAFAGQL